MDLAVPALARARAQLALIRERLRALERVGRGSHAGATVARAVIAELKARRAELNRLCERGTLRAYSQVLLDASRSATVSPDALHAIDGRYGVPLSCDPVAAAALALRLADGRDPVPAGDWLGVALARLPRPESSP